VDTVSFSEWGALPAGLILHVLESLTHADDVTSARGACAAWRTAHDRFATALAPTALPLNSGAVVAASFPALTALDLTHIATGPTALHALAGLTRLSSLTLPWGVVLGGDEAPLTGVRRLTAKVYYILLQNISIATFISKLLRRLCIVLTAVCLLLCRGRPYRGQTLWLLSLASPPWT
jgi:hypothetical protein